MRCLMRKYKWIHKAGRLSTMVVLASSEVLTCYPACLKSLSSLQISLSTSQFSSNHSWTLTCNTGWTLRSEKLRNLFIEDSLTSTLWELDSSRCFPESISSPFMRKKTSFAYQGNLKKEFLIERVEELNNFFAYLSKDTDLFNTEPLHLFFQPNLDSKSLVNAIKASKPPTFTNLLQLYSTYFPDTQNVD